jgi:hypothetical protein
LLHFQQQLPGLLFRQDRWLRLLLLDQWLLLGRLLPLGQWLRLHQPDLLLPPDRWLPLFQPDR